MDLEVDGSFRKYRFWHTCKMKNKVKLYFKIVVFSIYEDFKLKFHAFMPYTIEKKVTIGLLTICRLVLAHFLETL